MNEKIDLSKILKDCPIGWKFYSSVYGEVEFIGISYANPVPLHGQDDEWYFMEDLRRKKYPIRIKTKFGEYDVSHEGKLRVGAGECTLFPSKDQRDWSNFTAPWYKKEKFDPKTLVPFTKVLIWKDLIWMPTMFTFLDFSLEYPRMRYNTIAVKVIPYNNDTKHLVGTTEEAPGYYRYWED